MAEILDRISNEMLPCLGIDADVSEFCKSVLSELNERFFEVDQIAEYNQYKVLHAMQKNRLSDVHFAATNGYGYNDLGRDILESIYADVFHTELALVRPQVISGTHAISTALFANLKAGDELVSATGTPYDTLQGVIGIRQTKGSLIENGIIYKESPLSPDGNIDFDALEKLITKQTKMVAMQRSKGYRWRTSFSIKQIAQIISFIKNINNDIICFVDNCYGEFVDIDEPCDFGADITAGSLIKNPGGGLAPVGGYIVGKEEFVENASYRLTAPGLGREVGPSLGVTPLFMQGLFFAPTVVSGSVKGALFMAAIFEKLGFETLPKSTEKRSDIVQAVNLRSPEALLAFCAGIQKGAPVDSYVTPEPWDMPGYDCPVIMAAGAFVQGSSIELSADAPMKPPYIVFSQGGLTWYHAKIGIMMAVNELYKKGIISLKTGHI